MKDIIMVKFGGSILTDKHKPCCVRDGVMSSLASAVSDYWIKHLSGLILGNGGGSFGHYYAEKFMLKQGFHNKEGKTGMCKGKNSNAWLNTKLTKNLLDYGIPACSFPVDEMYFAKESAAYANDIVQWRRLLFYLDNEYVPVVYGDILHDRKKGCKIISTEDIFFEIYHVIMRNRSCGYRIAKMLFITDEDGIRDLRGRIIKNIDRKEFNNWEVFHKCAGYDVTGGMYGKVRMAMDMEYGTECSVQIVNGRFPERVTKALEGEDVLGTVISG